MAIPATQMRPGMIIKHNNELHAVFSVEHRTPGNLRAFIQAKLRNLRTGAMFEHRFRSPIPLRRHRRRNRDGIPLLRRRRLLLHEHRELRADAPEARHAGRLGRVPHPESADHGFVFRRQAVGIELPQTVEMTVVQTEPGLKSATASSVTKPAKVETGLVVQVPPFINEGEKIRVDTAEGAYLSRA